MSDAKKLGAVINPVEGGMPERLLADPDVQSALAAENARLRAELAAERVQHKSIHEMLCKEVDELEAERDALRALLREAREWADENTPLELINRIDAALKGDE